MRRLPIRPVSPRRGATLTEVLMAILIMSIGVVSVITLFPLAILRAVHASQLTNSKILQQNVEAIIQSNRYMILRGTGFDTSITPAVTTPVVVDPLGHLYMPTVRDYFGNENGTAGATYTSGSDAIVRSNRFTTSVASGGYGYSETDVDELFVLPDSWVVQFNEVPISVTEQDLDTTQPGMEAVDIVVPSNVSLVNLPSSARIVLISMDGTRNVVRTNVPIPSYNDTTKTIRLTYSNVLPALPANLNEISATEIGRVRLEVPERRYSWLLTTAPKFATATCVVFFRRGFDPAEENVVSLSTAAPVGTVYLDVTWTTGSEPLLKPDNYCFDAENGLWYRVLSVDPTSNTSATLELEHPLVAQTRTFMFPHGVIHTFPVKY